ncbi:MAG: DNA-binding protein WhiA [Clostridia bacterium]|nr:DNA-binding protein WhiA [Clostridia bacterium]
MSFSQDTKQELSKINNLAKKDEVKQELIGYLISCNTTITKGNNLRYSTENEYNINRFAKLLNNLNIQYTIEMEGKSFVIKFKYKDDNYVKIEENKIFLNNQYLSDFSSERKNLKDDEIKILVRGTFLGGGSINNPENKYHLELKFSNENNANTIKKILQKYNINFKTLYRANKYSLYLKEGEEISNFLALIGANSAVLKFEDIRVQREMRGKVNRLVNCKSANLNKTINASVEQIDAIRKLQKTGKFNKLDDNLKEIANLRLKNPDMPLSELGKLLTNPVGKSGVNYRLKKIIDISKESI